MRKKLTIILLLLSTWATTSAQLDGRGISPDFTLIDIDGVEHHLYGYLDQGKVVVLDFFAVWCSICEADAPYLREVYAEYGPDGKDEIIFLSLEADDDSSDEETRDFATKHESTNPHINDTQNVPELFSQYSFPTYYVIAPDRSYYSIGGRQETMKAEMIEAIQQAPGLRTVENDLRILEFNQPKGSYCEAAVYPTIRVQNYGKNTIEQFEVLTKINGEIASRFPYVEALDPYRFIDLRLPWLNNLSAGWQEISFEFVAVNGAPDGDPGNGILGGDFLMIPDGVQVDVVVTTDPYPKETRWKILKSDREVANVAGYTKGITTDTTAVCVEHGDCYRLLLLDSYGDGMSFGGVTIRYLDTEIARIDANQFSKDSIWVDFCVEPNTSSIWDQQANDLDFKVFPNPSSGYIELEWNYNEWVEIQVFNALGQSIEILKFPGGANKTHLDLSDSETGLYFVRLKSASGTKTKRVLIEH